VGWAATAPRRVAAAMMREIMLEDISGFWFQREERRYLQTLPKVCILYDKIKIGARCFLVLSLPPLSSAPSPPSPRTGA